MISRYNNFQLDLLLEKIINETYIYFSPDLEKVLRKTKSDIGYDLLSISKTDIKPDVTFVNIDKGKEDYLSFTTARNAGNNLSKIWTHVKPDDWFTNVLNGGDLDAIWGKRGDVNDVYSKSRNSLRIGRFVNKVFPGKYTDKQIEEFVNAFKASIESKERFEIVEGEDIVKWYNYRNYLTIRGTLGNSCMKDKSDSTFRIYVSNPEICRMLILRSDDDDEKIIGRALIWKLSSIKRAGKDLEGVEYFMDRQYTINDSDVVKFKNYAKEQGWAYKAYNNHHSFEPIFYKDEEFNAKMTVQLVGKHGGDFDYSSYPYMDTFRRYDPENGILYNDDNTDSKNKGNYILASTNGSYEEIEGGVWSEWYDRRISEEDAIWSDWADSYLDRDRVVEVTNGSRRYHGVYPEDCEDITYDEWNEFYIHINDAVYSDHYEYSLFDEDAVEVIAAIDSDGEPEDSSGNFYHKDDDDKVSIDEDTVWFEVLSDRFRYWNDHNYIAKSLMTKDYHGRWIPKMYAVDVYEIEESGDNPTDIVGIKYLTKLDAEILGYKVTSDSRVVDCFEYHRDIEPILGKLYRIASKEWVRLKQQLNGKGQLRIKFNDFNEDSYLKSLDKKADLYDDRLKEIEDDTYISTDFTITRNDEI